MPIDQSTASARSGLRRAPREEQAGSTALECVRVRRQQSARKSPSHEETEAEIAGDKLISTASMSLAVVIAANGLLPIGPRS